MITYVDANALMRYYLMTQRREKLLTALGDAGVFPVPITHLIKFEVMNAIEKMVFETRNVGTARITPEMAMVAQSDFETDLSQGSDLRLVNLSLSDIDSQFDSLVRRHTATHGFRTYDVMHVASALKLHCKRFLSFDAKANALSKLVGLKTL